MVSLKRLAHGKIKRKPASGKLIDSGSQLFAGIYRAAYFKSIYWGLKGGKR